MRCSISKYDWRNMIYLKSRRHNGTGTICENRIPKSCAMKHKKEMKKIKIKKGQYESRWMKDGNIHLVKWVDNSTTWNHYGLHRVIMVLVHRLLFRVTLRGKEYLFLDHALSQNSINLLMYAMKILGNCIKGARRIWSNSSFAAKLQFIIANITVLKAREQKPTSCARENDSKVENILWYDRMNHFPCAYGRRRYVYSICISYKSYRIYYVMLLYKQTI